MKRAPGDAITARGVTGATAGSATARRPLTGRLTLVPASAAPVTVTATSSNWVPSKLMVSWSRAFRRRDNATRAIALVPDHDPAERRPESRTGIRKVSTAGIGAGGIVG